MDDINRSISRHVQKGDYYLDARKWYANNFIFLASQRTYIIVLLMFFAISFAILGFFYQQTEPAPPEINYISRTPDIARYYAVIFPAGDPSDPPQIQVTKYMLSKYVRIREAYKFNNIADQLNFVRNTTVESEYLKYQNMMSINNPSSPMMLYQDSNINTIKIHNVQVLPSTDTLQKALVYFQASLKNLNSNKVNSEEMIAMISFQIDDIEILLNTNAKRLNFLVKEYSLHAKN